MAADTPSQRVTKRMRDHLEAADLSVRQVSSRSGVPAPSLYRYFQGRRPWPLDVLYAVCVVLGADPADVVRDPETAVA